MSSFWIVVILVFYFGMLLLISRITGRRTDNLGFFLGNRASPWYVVAFGMIGASLSGVTFISVPGWVGSSHFSYLQMVLGYLAGYQVIVHFLLPLYYRLGLTSIYSYLESRFGFWSHKSGAFYFILSRTIGAAARLFIASAVLQMALYDSLGIPFWAGVLITIALIWLYTFRGGIKTIIWTDTLQTLFMLLALVFTIGFIWRETGLGLGGLLEQFRERGYSRIFHFDDFVGDRLHFLKYFLGGMFITITMTGLDQDMMQKNLSCRSLKDAQKNMNWFSLSLIPVNMLFLFLGGLLFLFAGIKGIALPEASDDLFPMIATQGFLPSFVTLIFIIGLTAAAFSSADSAMTALTTAITVDMLGISRRSEEEVKRMRLKVHVVLALVMLGVILLFKALNNRSIIDTIFTIAGYTYGPLLGLYAFGMFSHHKVRDKWVPLVVLVSPVLTYAIQAFSPRMLGGYVFGFELLLINGLLTVLMLWLIKKPGGARLSQ